MKINIKATNMEMVENVSNYVNKKIESITKLISKKDTGALCGVEVGRTSNHHKSGDIFRAEIKIQTLGQVLYASAEKDDIYAAIDQAKDEIKEELLKFKTKKNTLDKKSGAKVKNTLKNIK